MKYPRRPRKDVCECGHPSFEHKIVGFFRVTSNGHCETCMCPKGEFTRMLMTDYINRNTLGGIFDSP